jgi:hypothetical protein
MKKADIIVDTCVWIEYFKGSPKIKEAIGFLVHEHSLYLCGIVVYELFQGIKDQKEKEMVQSDFEAFPYLEMNRSTWARAANLSLSLRNKGITLPSSDLFLASLAIENKCLIFTKDFHFDKIPGVSLYNHNKNLLQ